MRKKTESHPLTLPPSEYLILTILTHFWLKSEASHTQNKNKNKNKNKKHKRAMCNIKYAKSI